MTNSAPATRHRIVPTGLGGTLRWILFVALAGSGIGALTALMLYSTTPVYVALLPVAGALLAPTLFLKNFRLYWFAIFLLSLQFTASKNLNDGLAVRDDLKVDYIIQHFTFEITASDLAFLMLCVIWINDRLFNKSAFRFPFVAWLAVVYLGLALLSIVGAWSPYLGLVELSRQLKFLLVFLFAVNCLEAKSAIRVLAIVCVITLVTQAAMTVLRVKIGYYSPIAFGDSQLDVEYIRKYLTVDRYDDSTVRGFGTLNSPGSTVRLCMLMLPFVLFLCVPNAMFKGRLAFAGLAAFSLVGLAFTFDRVYFITTAFQLVLVFFIMLRERMVKRDEAIAIVLIGTVAVAAVSPKLYDQFTLRQNSKSVRFLQYEAAANMILAHPFLGVGLNNSTDKKRDYLNITYYEYDADTHFFTEPTHNVYLSMASEVGVPATLLFVAFFGSATVTAWRQSRGSPDPEIRLAANALLVAFCSGALNSMMDPLDETPVLTLLWLYAGISLNLHRMTQKPATAAQSEKASLLPA